MQWPMILMKLGRFHLVSPEVFVHNSNQKNRFPKRDETSDCDWKATSTRS